MLSRRLKELGLSPVVVLRHAGLPMGLFDQERILLTTEDMFDSTAPSMRSAAIPPSGSNSEPKNA